MTRRALFFSFLLLIIPATARAANVVVPVSGAATDLVITNLEAKPARVLITCYVTANVRSFVTVNVLPYDTYVAEVASDTTLIRVSGADVIARYGDVPAIDIDALPTEEIVQGSLTIANPWNIAATITIGTQQLLLQPDEVRTLDLPSSMRLTANVGVYVSSALPRSIAALSPPCAEPAPLGAGSSSSYLVVRSDSADVASLTAKQIASLRCDASVAFLEPNVVE